MAKRSRPMTPAEARLVEAYVELWEHKSDDDYSVDRWAKTTHKLTKAVAAVVKERKGRE